MPKFFELTNPQDEQKIVSRNELISRDSYAFTLNESLYSVSKQSFNAPYLKIRFYLDAINFLGKIYAVGQWVELENKQIWHYRNSVAEFFITYNCTDESDEDYIISFDGTFIHNEPEESDKVILMASSITFTDSFYSWHNGWYNDITKAVVEEGPIMNSEELIYYSFKGTGSVGTTMTIIDELPPLPFRLGAILIDDTINHVIQAKLNKSLKVSGSSSIYEGSNESKTLINNIGGYTYSKPLINENYAAFGYVKSPVTKYEANFYVAERSINNNNKIENLYRLKCIRDSNFEVTSYIWKVNINNLII